MRRLSLCLLAIITAVLPELSWGESFRVGLNLTVYLDDEGTAFVHRDGFEPSSFSTGTHLRISRRGVGRYIVVVRNEAYLLDRSYVLWRLDKSRYSYWMAKLITAMKISIPLTGIGTLVYLGMPGDTNLPWMLNILYLTTTAVMTPLSYPGEWSALKWFDGVDLFTQKVDEQVTFVERLRDGDYEVIYLDPGRRPVRLSHYDVKSSPGFCAGFLRSLWRPDP